MSVRVIGRIRPLLNAELERDQILSVHNGSDNKPQVVKIPNPKNLNEEYSFHFNSVYDQEASQQDLFDAEVAPTLKHLFLGFDVTLFAYGVTGTGKTHTMRGGKSLVDRGMIPRMLSSIYRKSKALERSSSGSTTVSVCMSYYEIYNDKVFDLFEPPEKRTPHGLPIREAEGGRTVIAGLSELSCSSLKEFEILYDRANSNRSVGATKLNAQSSRSHAILCVKVTISSASEERSSTVSAIDLAGSEDNRRTGNVKERMVESASINKSLFVLAQCVEAISKKQPRVPYRESKMTRILSLGQNNGLTVMILNLAPTRSYHLDTLSSLNFANRTKKIEIREIENETVAKGLPRPPSNTSTNIHLPRQPLRALSTTSTNILANKENAPAKQDKVRLFSVYADKPRTTAKSSPLKRKATSDAVSSHPLKQSKTSSVPHNLSSVTALTAAALDSLVEKKVAEVLAAREAAAVRNKAAPQAGSIQPTVSAEVQARLDMIERRLEGQEGERAEGLSYLFMAKQAQARDDDREALSLYERAQPFFSGNEKLEKKIEKLRAKLSFKKRSRVDDQTEKTTHAHNDRHTMADDDDGAQADTSYQYESAEDSYYHDRKNDSSDDEDERPQKKLSKRPPPKHKKRKVTREPCSISLSHDQPHSDSQDTLVEHDEDPSLSRKTKQLISIFNTGDVSQLKQLPGLGSKKAEAIAEHLSQRKEERGSLLSSWQDIVQLEIRGVGRKTWEIMRENLVV